MRIFVADKLFGIFYKADQNDNARTDESGEEEDFKNAHA